MSGTIEPLYLQEDTHISTKHPLFSKQWFDLHRPLVVGGFLIGGLLLVALLFNHTNQQGMDGFTTQGAGTCVEKVNCDQKTTQSACHLVTVPGIHRACIWNENTFPKCGTNNPPFPSNGECADEDEDECAEHLACERVYNFDCPSLNKDFGDSCDDGNIDTDNDVVTNNCKCIGECINPPRYYLDADQDGYGGSEVYLDTCFPPAGYVLPRDEVPRWDCDDSDPAVRRDCNNTVVCEGSTPCEINGECVPETLYYEDADQDGYGDLISTTLSCEPVTGFVDNNNDCDDSNNIIHPGVDESNYCSDGKDNDCDGDIDQNDSDCTSGNIKCNECSIPNATICIQDRQTEINSCDEKRLTTLIPGFDCDGLATSNIPGGGNDQDVLPGPDPTNPPISNPEQCRFYCNNGYTKTPNGDECCEDLDGDGQCGQGSVAIKCSTCSTPPNTQLCNLNKELPKGKTCNTRNISISQNTCPAADNGADCDYVCLSGYIENPNGNGCCEDPDGDGQCGVEPPPPTDDFCTYSCNNGIFALENQNATGCNEVSCDTSVSDGDTCCSQDCDGMPEIGGVCELSIAPPVGDICYNQPQFDFDNDGDLDMDDVDILRQLILGIRPGVENPEIIFPGKNRDPNNSGGLSTIDLVIIQRVLQVDNCEYDPPEATGYMCNASTNTCSECTIGTPGCYNTLGDCESNCQSDVPDTCEGECAVGTKQCGQNNNAVEECVDGGSGCNAFVATICSEKSLQCSDGTTRTCQRTCVKASCQDCVLDPCPTPEDPPKDPCEGVVCEDSVRYCEYGGDQSCSNSCTNGQCGSCTPNQCQTPPNPTPPAPNPTPPKDPPSCDDVTRSPDPSTVCSGTEFDQTSNCGNTREVSGTKDCVSYKRVLGSYGNCSETCGGGTRTASYICKSSAELEVADSFCERNESKPADKIETCNEVKCNICEDGALQLCDRKEYEEGGVRCKEGKYQICRNNVWGNCGEEIKKTCEDIVIPIPPNPTPPPSICVEGSKKPCGSKKGECTQGVRTCTDGKRSVCIGGIQPSNETCDELDNDCDGQTDEGVKNLCGTCGLVPDEICDGADNDCDGTVDEGCGCDDGDTQSCGTDTGQCSEGSQTCTDGARGDCVGGVAAVSELCDGLDNDCDGEIDENTKNACGVCGEVPDEICDDLDNDCDGEVDEGSVCLECIVGSTEVCGSDEGRCEKGLRTCTVDGRSACEGDIPPVGELCDSQDNDCDGEIDENLECHRGGGGRRGGQNFCGDGLLRLNLGEECDDGNNTDGDGCSRNCRLEGGISPVQPDEPGLTIELALRHASQKLRMACDYDDVAYDEIAFRDIERETSGSPADILRTYCIVKGYDKTNRTLYHADASTSVAEWIKIVSKIHAMGTDQEFDEYNQYNGHLNFTDVRDTKRYASYVGYADKVGLLDGVGIKFGSLRLLKPTTPISKERAARILKNAGATKSYTLEMGSGKYLRRDAAAAIAVHAFSDTFADYRYMYGNNIELYQALLDKITGMTEADQKVFIRSFITRLSALNSDVMGKKFNLHIVGMVLFLESILDGSYQFGNPMHGSAEHGSAGPQTPVDRIIIDDYYDLRDFLGL